MDPPAPTPDVAPADNTMSPPEPTLPWPTTTLMPPPVPDDAGPVWMSTTPLRSNNDAPVAIVIAPDCPADDTVAVDISMLPDEDRPLPPDNTATLPPTEESLVDPADINSEPPAPESPEPTITLTAPPLPPVAEPDINSTDPEFPLNDAPVRRDSLPLAPADAALAVDMDRDPDPLLVLAPLEITTEPPC